jgi:hypothetical protein
MHFDAIIDGLGGVLGGGRSEAVDREGGATPAETLFIG